MTQWILVGIMSDTLPEAPSPPAPDNGHKIMAFQWWTASGRTFEQVSFSARVAGTSLRAYSNSDPDADYLWFTCMSTSPVGGDPQATMKITFQKVNETTGELSPGSPIPGWEKELAEGFPAEHTRGDLVGHYSDVDYWTVPFGNIRGAFTLHNPGLYTFAIDFDGPDGPRKYYLDPLLRIDPPAR